MSDDKYLSRETLIELCTYISESRAKPTDISNMSFLNIKDFFGVNLGASKEMNDIFDELYKISGEKIDFEKELDFLKDKVTYADVASRFLMEKSFFTIKQSSLTKVLKKMHHDDPRVVRVLHDYISSNKNKEKFNIDLHDTYYQLLKSKKTNKKDFNKQEILDNIKSFDIKFFKHNEELSLAELNSITKKINIYLTLFKNNMELYNIINDDLGKYINTSPIIKKFFEEKMVKFPQDVKDLYFSNKSSSDMDLINDTVSLKYNIAISSEGIMAKYNIGSKYSQELLSNFYAVLFEHYAEKYDLTSKRYVHNGKSLELTANEENINLVKEDFTSIKIYIPELFKELVESKSHMQYPSIDVQQYFKDKLYNLDVIKERDFLQKALPEKTNSNRVVVKV